MKIVEGKKMRKLFCYLLFGAISVGSLHAETQVLSEVKALSATSLLKTADDRNLSVITLPTVYDAEGRVAKGTQIIDFSLNANAAFGVNVGGQDVAPGESIQFDFQANELGGLDIPVYSSGLGILGTSQFSLYINEVKAISCPNGYTLSSSETYCYAYSYADADSYSCNGRGGYNYRTKSGSTKGSHYETCYAIEPTIYDSSYSCPSGYTKHKWNYNSCTDTKAYTAANTESEKNKCTSAGGRWQRDTKNYTCLFLSPAEFSVPQICPTNFEADNGFCLDPSNTGIASLINCPSGYNVSAHADCEQMYTRPPE